MGIGTGRDPEAVASGLKAWWQARHPRHSDIEIPAPTRPSAGLSSETFLVDVRWTEDGQAHDEALVLRMAPSGDGLFPSYELAEQALVQQQLAALSPLPVPAPVAMERDEQWMGGPFLLMARLPGRVLLDHPPFLTQGWLHDAPPAQQQQLQQAFIDVLATIHRLDWRGLGLETLARGRACEPPFLVGELAWWAAYLEWAGESPPIVSEAMAWCVAHRPVHEPAPSLLWGDARFGNVLFDGAFYPVGVLDWEMASIGPAELDVGWFVVMHELSVETAGADLPGFLNATQLISDYQQRLGRELHDLLWYEAFALVRGAAIMVRVAHLLAGLGVDDSWLRGNPMLAQLDRVVSQT
jgi:aminoglycoside phosphotransferase (APT) family kinase protein